MIEEQHTKSLFLVMHMLFWLLWHSCCFIVHAIITLNRALVGAQITIVTPSSFTLLSFLTTMCVAACSVMVYGYNTAYYTPSLCPTCGYCILSIACIPHYCHDSDLHSNAITYIMSGSFSGFLALTGLYVCMYVCLLIIFSAANAAHTSL